MSQTNHARFEELLHLTIVIGMLLFFTACGSATVRQDSLPEHPAPALEVTQSAAPASVPTCVVSTFDKYSANWDGQEQMYLAFQRFLGDMLRPSGQAGPALAIPAFPEMREYIRQNGIKGASND